MTKLTEAQKVEAQRLGAHALSRVTAVFDNVAGQCSDPRQRAQIALHLLAGLIGLASVEIDRAEGREPVGDEPSPEAFDLIAGVVEMVRPAGRAALARQGQGQGGRDDDA